MVGVTYLLMARIVLVGRHTSGSITSSAPSPSPSPMGAHVAGAGSSARHVSGESSAKFDLRELLIQSGIALGIVSVAVVALGWLAAGRILRPLATITATARRISATSLHERLSLPGPDDELKDLGDTLDDLLDRLEASFEAQRHFVANASHELRLVTNPIDNAVKHNIPGGCIKVTTGNSHGHAVLSVASTGPVIPPADVGRLFQPFQRLHPRRNSNSNGLGLSIVRAIAAAHDADITAQAPPDGGLVVTVTFPPPGNSRLLPSDGRVPLVGVPAPPHLPGGGSGSAVLVGTGTPGHCPVCGTPVSCSGVLSPGVIRKGKSHLRHSYDLAVTGRGLGVLV
jgi:signal transduction histidine kinase